MKVVCYDCEKIIRLRRRGKMKNLKDELTLYSRCGECQKKRTERIKKHEAEARQNAPPPP